MQKYILQGKEVYIAKTAGFCMGVKRAVKMVISATIERDETLFTYGPLVHNNQVTDILDSLGVKCLNHDDLSNSDYPDERAIFIRAHGIPPEEQAELTQNQFKVSDATCPHVKAAHKIVTKYAKQGHFCVIYGNPNHAEVQGILGYTNQFGLATTDASELDKCGLPADQKICVLSQTTQNEKSFYGFTNAITEKYPNTIVKNTICDATEERQSELKDLASQVDLTIVIGGKHSGNTKRLYEISSSLNSNTIWIETAKELIPYKEKIFHAKKIGISAGASTPQWILESVKDMISRLTVLQKSPILYHLNQTLELFVKNCLLIGFTSAFFTWFVCQIFQSKATLSLSLMSGIYMFVMFFGQRIKEIEYKDPVKFRFYRNNERKLKRANLALLAIGFLLALPLGFPIWATYLILSGLGTAYIVANKYNRFQHLQKWIKQFPGSKDFAVAFCWTIFSVFFPYIIGKPHLPELLLVGSFTFSAILCRTMLLDLRDYYSDRIMGKDTLIIFMTPSRYLILLIGIGILNLLLSLLLVPVFKAGAGSLIIVSIVMLFQLAVLKKNLHVNKMYYEILLDGIFMLPAIMGLFLL